MCLQPKWNNSSNALTSSEALGCASCHLLCLCIIAILLNDLSIHTSHSPPPNSHHSNDFNHILKAARLASKSPTEFSNQLFAATEHLINEHPHRLSFDCNIEDEYEEDEFIEDPILSDPQQLQAPIKNIPEGFASMTTAPIQPHQTKLSCPIHQPEAAAPLVQPSAAATSSTGLNPFEPVVKGLIQNNTNIDDSPPVGTDWATLFSTMGPLPHT